MTGSILACYLREVMNRRNFMALGAAAGSAGLLHAAPTIPAPRT